MIPPTSSEENSVVGDESFEVAAALGSPMPAPSGSLIVTLTVFDYEVGGVAIEKQFRSLEEAETALARWCVQRWEDMCFCPWKDEPDYFRNNTDVWRIGMSSWLDGKTPKDVVEEYFSASDGEVYSYEPMIMRQEPEWSGSQEALRDAK